MHKYSCFLEIFHCFYQHLFLLVSVFTKDSVVFLFTLKYAHWHRTLQYMFLAFRYFYSQKSLQCISFACEYWYLQKTLHCILYEYFSVHCIFEYSYRTFFKTRRVMVLYHLFNHILSILVL